MRRLALGCLGLALVAASAAPSAQIRPPQADAVVRLLADLESALAANRPGDLRALAAPSIAPADLTAMDQSFARGTIVGATVRERARRAVGNGFEVLADVLVSRGRTGRIATWQLTVRPKADAPDRYEIAGFLELAAFDGLLQIALDSARTFTVHNLAVQAPDFTLKMASGTAFAAEEASGVTALVLLGRADVRFSPPDPGEQGQLKLFDGSPALETTADAAFIRLNPAEFSARISEHSLLPRRDPPVDFGRAQAIFADLAPKTFNLDLADLTDEHWSIEPSPGSFVLEFRTNRYGWLTYSRAPSESEDLTLFDRAHGRNISSYASAEKLAQRGRFYSEDDGTAYDVERYGLDLTFDPARLWISGRGSLRVKIRNTATASITLKLAQPLAVSSVSSPNFGRLLALRIAGQNNILVGLPATVMPDTSFVLDVVYSGRLEPQTLEREAIAPQQQTVLGQPQDPSTMMPVLEPERRYLYSSRAYWYPQGPVSDYATAAMRLTVPSQFQIVASGSLVGVKVTGARDETGRADTRMVRTVEYSADRPVRYLSCVISRFVPVARQRAEVPAVAPASVADRREDAAVDPTGVSIEVVATPIAASRNRQLLARAVDMIRTYAKIIGEAPYPDFTIAAIEDNVPGGHSPPYFAMLLQPLPTSPFSWANDPVAFDNTYPQLFLAHEVAHQWWGQAVGWKNYHEQWLSEGFAQYFAVLYAGADRGPDMMRNLLGQMRDSAARYASQGPISLGYRLGHIQSEGRVFRAIEYNKSAVVLHMLRRLIGDEAFFAGIRRFYHDWRFRKAGTDDVRQAFEAGTPIKLARFFDRWITEAALPRIAVTSRVDASSSSASVRIEQTGEVFDFPFTVTIQYADGRSEDVTIPVTEQSVERSIPLKGPVKKIATRDELALVTYVK